MTQITAPAAPLTTSGIPAATARPIAGAQANTAPAGNTAVSTSYSPQPVNGGGLVQDMGNAVANMVARSSAKSKSLQNEIDAILKSDGEVPPEKMSLINREQSQQEMIMQMAKQMQDREERMQRIWVQPG